MHEDLLRLAFGLLDRLSEKLKLQLLIATHSPVLIDAAGLSNVLLIDRSEQGPRKAQDVEALIPMLADRGLSLPPSKVMDTLKSRRVLFVDARALSLRQRAERILRHLLEISEERSGAKRE